MILIGIYSCKQILQIKVKHCENSMISQRPETRRTSLQKMILSETSGCSTSFDEIQFLISHQFYDHALTALTKVSSFVHWTACKKAQIYFELSQKRRAICHLRESYAHHDDSCLECFNLLQKILFKYPSMKRSVEDLIEKACKHFEFCRELDIDLSIKITENQKSSPSKYERGAKLLMDYEEKGVYCSKIELHEVEKDSRIVKAQQQIQPNQIIIFVPEIEIITLEKAKANSSLKEVMKIWDNLASPKHSLMALFLLMHKQMKHQSQYSKYISTLPEELPNFPIFFPDQLLKELEGTSFLNILLRKKKEIQADYQEVKKAFKHDLPLQQFVWARMIVSSRIFSVFIHGVRTEALVPVADLINHGEEQNATWYFSDDKNGFIIENLEQRIRKGQQINDSYGIKCNSRFLLNYGFTLPSNQENQLIIELGDHNNFKSSIPKLRLTKSLDSNFKFFIAYLRNLIHETDSLQAAKVNFMRMVSLQNEINAWNFFYQTIRDQLNSFPTSLAADRKLESKKNISENLRNCIRIRIGEKIIEEFYTKVCRDILKLLQGKQRRKIPNMDLYGEYLREIRIHEFVNIPQLYNEQ